MKKIPWKDITVADVQEMAREGVPFTSRSFSGFPGSTDATGELPRGLAIQYMQTGVTFTLMSYETPIAWLAGTTWTVPDVTYSATTNQHQAFARMIAGLK